MNKLKKNDNVLVMAGKDKGKTGQVREVRPKDGRAIVTGVNMIKKHQRATSPQQPAGIIEREAAIQIANLMVVCSNCGKPARVGIHFRPDGKKSRYCKKCNEDFD
ncbi:MAG TPA: 50S ribosomal protein L24 [Dehalococcoidia bacterium]|nr:50S ribosomal protein L24 [Dehalococcoidia bacterium]